MFSSRKRPTNLPRNSTLLQTREILSETFYSILHVFKRAWEPQSERLDFEDADRIVKCVGCKKPQLSKNTFGAWLQIPQPGQRS